jgi:hypothetical protein
MESSKRSSPRLCLCGSTSASTARRAASTAGLETTSGTSLSADTSTATTSRTAPESSTELLRSWAALFNLEVDAVDVVRVGSDRGLVGGRSLEINEGAVLQILLAPLCRSSISSLPLVG